MGWDWTPQKNAKPFLICSVYRPPGFYQWMDRLARGRAFHCTVYAFRSYTDVWFQTSILFRNQKENGLIWCRTLTFCNLFKNQHVSPKQAQLWLTMFTRPIWENISNFFVSKLSMSDHFPVCFSRKINSRMPTHENITTSYRCYNNLMKLIFWMNSPWISTRLWLIKKTVDGDMNV